jgi:hypothetical protein
MEHMIFAWCSEHWFLTFFIVICVIETVQIGLKAVGGRYIPR